MFLTRFVIESKNSVLVLHLKHECGPFVLL